MGRGWGGRRHTGGTLGGTGGRGGAWEYGVGAHECGAVGYGVLQGAPWGGCTGGEHRNTEGAHGVDMGHGGGVGGKAGGAGGREGSSRGGHGGHSGGRYGRGGARGGGKRGETHGWGTGAYGGTWGRCKTGMGGARRGVTLLRAGGGRMGGTRVGGGNEGVPGGRSSPSDPQGRGVGRRMWRGAVTQSR